MSNPLVSPKFYHQIHDFPGMEARAPRLGCRICYPNSVNDGIHRAYLEEVMDIAGIATDTAVYHGLFRSSAEPPEALPNGESSGDV